MINLKHCGIHDTSGWALRADSRSPACQSHRRGRCDSEVFLSVGEPGLRAAAEMSAASVSSFRLRGRALSGPVVT